MPQLIQHIDAIAREKQQDVLAVEFDFNKSSFKTHWLAHEARKTICDWLDANHIPYYPCGNFANDTGMVGYRGQLYIDIPNNEEDRLFKKVKAFLVNLDGSPKIVGASLNHYSLEICKKNLKPNKVNF